MQLASQRRDELDDSISGARSIDYTPSGVYPVGRARRSRPRPMPDPFIVVEELDEAEATAIALLEVENDELDWDDDEPTQSYGRAGTEDDATEQPYTFELLPPVSTDVKLPIVGDGGDAWTDEEETTRFERGVPVLLPRAFGDAELRQVTDLADEFDLAATGEWVIQRFSSPWAKTWRDEPVSAPQRTWRSWLLIAVLTVAAEAALLGTLALTLN